MHKKARPFLKWAGGKTQLLSQFEQFYPKDLFCEKINQYIEPFVGGGAVFFDVMQKFDIQTAYIADINKDLVLTYKVIQQNSSKLLQMLEKYQDEYDKTKEIDRNNLFLSIRETFNHQRFDIYYEQFSENWVFRAAQLIFLNKTCFNGLFRLNSKGEFNVPFGKYKKPTICDAENIIAVSKLLQNVNIKNSNYWECFNEIDAKTYVYFDPPYRPISKTASFTSYSGFEFSENQQIDLSNFYKKIDAERNAKLMLSNSDANDNFFEKIYNGYYFHRVSAIRAINCNGDKRGKINELVITNYQ